MKAATEAGDCCEFDPYDPADYEPGEVIEESWHYRRTCPGCGEVWWSLHCPHDGVQRPCPGCGAQPPGSRTPLEFLLGVSAR